MGDIEQFSFIKPQMSQLGSFSFHI